MSVSSYADTVETLLKQGQEAYQDKDYAKAIKLYEQAVTKGHAMAAATLAKLYYDIEPVSQSQDVSKQALATRNPIVLTQLGMKYRFGDEINQDYETAIQLFVIAVAYGSTEALIHLAEMHYVGHGVKKNDLKAIKYYEEAVARGSIDGLYGLGMIYYQSQSEIRYTKARHYFELAAARGHAESYNQLGQFYHNGRGVNIDYTKARECFEKAIDLLTDPNCVMDSFIELSNYYRNGYGVTKDLNKAINLLIEGYRRCNITNRWRFTSCLKTIFEKDETDLMDYLINQNTTMDQLRHDLTQEKSHIAELETQIEYQPSGPGFERARDEFNALAKTASSS